MREKWIQTPAESEGDFPVTVVSPEKNASQALLKKKEKVRRLPESRAMESCFDFSALRKKKISRPVADKDPVICPRTLPTWWMDVFQLTHCKV